MRPTMLAVVRIMPVRRSRKWGRIARNPFATPWKVVSITAANASVGVSSNFPKLAMPALLIQMSTRPKASTARSASRFTATGSRTSTGIAIARPPAAITSSAT